MKVLEQNETVDSTTKKWSEMNEPGQSCLTHAAVTALALFLLLCCLHQTLEVFVLCLSCLTGCLLLFNSVSDRMIVQGKTQDKAQESESTVYRVIQKEGKIVLSSFCPLSVGE